LFLEFSIKSYNIYSKYLLKLSTRQYIQHKTINWVTWKKKKWITRSYTWWT